MIVDVLTLRRLLVAFLIALVVGVIASSVSEAARVHRVQLGAGPSAAIVVGHDYDAGPNYPAPASYGTALANVASEGSPKSSSTEWANGAVIANLDVVDTGAMGWGPVKPVVSDPELQEIADQLYRPGASVGNGGTADILRAQGTHIQKAWDRAVQLQQWLDVSPNASASDIQAANSMQQDLLSALAGQGYPGP